MAARHWRASWHATADNATRFACAAVSWRLRRAEIEERPWGHRRRCAPLLPQMLCQAATVRMAEVRAATRSLISRRGGSRPRTASSVGWTSQFLKLSSSLLFEFVIALPSPEDLAIVYPQVLRALSLRLLLLGWLPPMPGTFFIRHCGEKLCLPLALPALIASLAPSNLLAVELCGSLRRYMAPVWVRPVPSSTSPRRRGTTIKAFAPAQLFLLIQMSIFIAGVFSGAGYRRISSTGLPSNHVCQPDWR